jgi:hypothetical protein
MDYEAKRKAAQEKKERELTEIRALFPERVKQVAAILGMKPRFHSKRSNGGTGEPYSFGHAVIEGGSRVICFNTSEYSPDFRLAISGDYNMGPDNVSVSWPYGLSRPSITVGLRREAVAIAKEITTRFLPDYDAACTRIAEQVKQATDYRDSLRSTTDRLAAIAGVKVREVHGTKELRTEFFKYYGANSTEPRLEVKASSDGAEIKFDCGVELAAAVIKAIEALATVANPSHYSIQRSTWEGPLFDRTQVTEGEHSCKLHGDTHLYVRHACGHEYCNRYWQSCPRCYGTGGDNRTESKTNEAHT